MAGMRPRSDHLPGGCGSSHYHTGVSKAFWARTWCISLDFGGFPCNLLGLGIKPHQILGKPPDVVNKWLTSDGRGGGGHIAPIFCRAFYLRRRQCGLSWKVRPKTGKSLENMKRCAKYKNHVSFAVQRHWLAQVARCIRAISEPGVNSGTLILKTRIFCKFN